MSARTPKSRYLILGMVAFTAALVGAAMWNTAPTLLSERPVRSPLGMQTPSLRDDTWEETRNVAAQDGFDYEAVASAAMAGNKEAIGRLMQFSVKVDAASAVGHGVVLGRVALSVGDESFASVVRQQTPQVRHVLLAVLPAVAYSKDPKCSALTLDLLPATRRELFVQEPRNGDIP